VIEKMMIVNIVKTVLNWNLNLFWFFCNADTFPLCILNIFTNRDDENWLWISDWVFRIL